MSAHSLCRTLLPLFLALLSPSLFGQGLGISNGFPYTSSVDDTLLSPYLPSLNTGPAGAHGFLKQDAEGGWLFDDGTPARFFGVTLQWSACLPDSMRAIMTAARLRKLGVNLVRFKYFDNSYDWAQSLSILDVATGARTLHVENMRRFDWFIYQLKAHGIYVYLPLQSARAPRASDGIGAAADSALWIDRSLNFLYPQLRAIHKGVATQILGHRNPYTGKAYKDEPAIAMLETLDEGSLLSYYHLNQTEHVQGANTISWKNSRRLDTLFSSFLRSRYGSNAGVTAAWRTTPPTGGFPNLLVEPSFEGDFERNWYIESYDGTSISKILTGGDSVPHGSFALTLRVRNTRGNVYSAYMYQQIPVKFNTLYRVSFKAKCSNPEGRRMIFANSQSVEGGLGGGLSGTVMVTPYWKEHELFFLVPVKGNIPMTTAMYFGETDGDLSLDDFKIEEYESPGLLATESIDNYSVARIPWRNQANAIVSSKRVLDQTDFYMALEGDYYREMRKFVQDTVGARQQVTGAGHYWASNYMEASVQASEDFTAANAGWDYISSDQGHWNLRNYSPLRTSYPGAFYVLPAFAHRRQPFVAEYSQPYPSRYQAEAMMMFPAYSSLQGWDAMLWGTYSDVPDRGVDYIDSLQHYQIKNNPVVTTLMPAASYLFQMGLLSQAQNTITIQHSREQIRLYPRLSDAWGHYAVPGGFALHSMIASRVVTDSTNAEYFTQGNDVAPPDEIEGEVRSDTREILWEYGRGTISLDAPRVQGTSGNLVRAGGVNLRNLDVTLQSNTETATLLWLPLDTSIVLSRPGRSFLVLTSRAEPSGWHWQDSSYADRWGKGPMLFDPVRVRLTFRPDDSVNVVRITPLDSSGMPTGAPIQGIRSGNGITLSIDQGITRAVWYSVDLISDPAASVPTIPKEMMLSAHPSIIDERSYVTITVAVASDDATLELFDALGRRVQALYTGSVAVGKTTIRLDASELSSGAYTLRLRTDRGEVVTTSVTVLR